MNAALALVEALTEKMGITPSEPLKRLTRASQERRKEKALTATTD
jgi:hypothetical protein